MTRVMAMPEQEMAISQLRAIATVISAVSIEDLEAFIAAREHAMAIGPILQPSSWLEHGFDDDRAWVRLAGAVLDLRKVIREVSGR